MLGGINGNGFVILKKKECLIQNYYISLPFLSYSILGGGGSIKAPRKL